MKQFFLTCAAVLALAAPAARAVEPDQLLPADAEGVLVVNVRQILDAPVIKKYALPRMQAALAKDEQVARPLAAAGIDPLRDVDSILLTAAGDQAANKMLVIVRGRFDLDKVHAAAADVARKSEGRLKAHTEGGLRIYEAPLGDGDKPAFLAFVDNKTLIASPSREFAAAVARGDARGLGQPSQEMKAALAKVGGTEPVWLAVAISDRLKKEIGRSPQARDIAGKLESITGSISLNNAFLATLMIHTADAQAAGQVEKLVNDFKQLLQVLAQAQAEEQTAPVFMELLNNLKVVKQAGGVRISLTVNEELAEKLNKRDKPGEQ